jgi:hypothetical protein
MAWFWIALILGGIVAPWTIMGSSIRIGFKEGGLSGGFGTWFGISILTIPIMLGAIWLGHFVIGR